MKVDKATAKYMLEVSKGWDSNADIGGEEVEEAFTTGSKQGRIKAFEDVIKKFDYGYISGLEEYIDTELKKLRSE